MTTKQLRRREDDWYRRMDKTGIETMATMFRWFQVMKPRKTKIAAYVAARQMVTGGRIPITLPHRLPS